MVLRGQKLIQLQCQRGVHNGRLLVIEGMPLRGSSSGRNGYKSLSKVQLLALSLPSSQISMRSFLCKQPTINILWPHQKSKPMGSARSGTVNLQNYESKLTTFLLKQVISGSYSDKKLTSAYMKYSVKMFSIQTFYFFTILLINNASNHFGENMTLRRRATKLIVNKMLIYLKEKMNIYEY